MKWIIDGKHDGMLLRDYLSSVQAFSRRMLKVVKTEGVILLNGLHVTVRERLHIGDKVEIQFPEEEKGRELSPQPIPLQIIFEDDDVLVINKQAGIPVIPSRYQSQLSIANGLLHYYMEQGLTYTVHIVTRLDRNTSGLMLIAKHRFSHSLLSGLQREGKVNRTYTTFVEGRLEKWEGTIDAPIGRKPSSIVEREVRQDGKQAITHYKVLKELQGFSSVEVRLETGRTHQIRVHFSYLGHPLVGDDLYGGSLSLMNRQALHCSKLSFYHPFLKDWMEFEVPVAEDMQSLVDE